LNNLARSFALLLAGMLVVLSLNACTADELEDAFYTGGKIVYDSFKGGNR